MTPFLQLAAVLAIIITTAKLAGYVSTKIGQPSVFGELLLGIILGPSLLNLINLRIFTDAHLGEIVSELGELGVMLLMFLAGLELNFRDLAKNARVSAYAGTLGVILPVGMGLAGGLLLGMDFQHGMFLGLTLGATSVSISAQTLMEMGKLRTRVGLGLLGAAVFDDVLVILLLSTYVALQGGGSGIASILLVLGKMIVFLVFSAAFGLWVLPRLTRLTSNLPISQGILSLALVILLVYGLAAELLGGMAAITGSFLAGLMFTRTPEREHVESGIKAISYGFLVPVFFVSIGLSVNLRDLDLNALWTLVLITLIAIAGKILGAGLGARLGKYSLRESVQLGIGMISRGEVGLIVAAVGLRAGLLNNAVFSSIVGMILITTIITPPMLRVSFNTSRPSKKKIAPEAIEIDQSELKESE